MHLLHCPQPAHWKQDIVGAYENKLRRHATPEKLFEYFSTVHNAATGASFMTPADLLRTVSSYNPALPVDEQSLGTNSPQMKGDIKSLVVSSETASKYQQLLHTAFAGASGAKEAAAAAWDMRTSGAVDASAHVTAVSQLQANGFAHCTTASMQVALSSLVPGAHFVSGLQSQGSTPSAAASFASLIDQNGDGLISFPEFMVFITVLALPAEQLDVAFHLFDADGSGTLDQSEYNALLRVLRKRTAAGKMADDSTITGAASQLSQVALPAAAGGGGDAPRRISFKAFHSFILEAKRLLRHIEIDRYSGGADSLTPLQFGRLVVGNAPASLQSALAERLSTRLAASTAERINMEDVQEYYMLLDNLGDLLFAMSLAGPLVAAKQGGQHQQGALTKQQFAHACAVVLTEMRKAEKLVTGGSAAVSSSLSPVTVDVLFALFDADGDGRLSISEISAAMEHHGSGGLQHREEEQKRGILGTAACFGQCLRS
mgnify:CR=1 FL=1